VKDIWVSIHAKTYSAYISISTIIGMGMETLATADQSHLFLGVGNHTLISHRMILQRDDGDLSYIRLTRPLPKESMACGLLLMVLPRSRIAGALWTILPWTTNANFAHDGFPNLCFLD
jgi:hypothetical protein